VDGLQGLENPMLKKYCFNKINGLCVSVHSHQGCHRVVCVVCVVYSLHFTGMTDVNIYCLADNTASCQAVILTA
jgi:hypothetical protein